MKKRLLKNLMFIMVMTILCFAVAMTASAETITGECGIEGDNLTWTLDTETGVLTIDGEGEMDNYSLYNNINKTSAPWWDYYSQITELVIGDEVTSIGDYAFYDCDALTSLDVSQNVKTIGNYTFYDCDKLKEITIPDSVTNMGVYSFAYSSSIETLKIGNGLTEIAVGAFYQCYNLYNIEFGTKLKIISKDAFYDTGYNCHNVIIPDGVEKIGDKAFYARSMLTYSVSIPLSVKEIGSLAFNHHEINDVYFDGTIEQWEKISIKNNDGLRNATFHFGHAHSYTPEITTVPTCLATGIKTFTCDCGSTYTRELSALGHDVIIEPAVSATCSETGLTKGEYCTRCDYKIEQEETPSLGHDMINLEASEPTCTETGLTAGVACSRCDEISEGRQETVPALGHDVVIDSAVAATCTETGLTEGEHCSRCDYKVEQEETPALGHKEVFTEYVEATCTETGLSVGKKCSVCGVEFIPAQVIPAKGHKLSNWIVTSKATCEKDGIKIKICSCGLTEEAVIPATGHADADVDEKCDSCSASLTNESEKPSEPAEKDNVFSFLKSFLNNLIDFFRKLFGIK